MLRVSHDNLLTIDVFQIVHQDLVRQHVNELLDVPSHYSLIFAFLQIAEVVVWEGRHKELHIELVPTIEKKLSNKRVTTYLKNTDASSIGSS